MADANATALKLCTRCGEKKMLDDFGKDAKRSFGRRTWCKPCHAASNARWRQRYPDRSKAACANWQSNNPEKARSKRKRFLEKQPFNYEAVRMMKWRKLNPERNKLLKLKQREREKHDPTARINHRIRRAIRSCLGGSKGWVPSFELLDFSSAELKHHIELQFYDGMNWAAFMRGDIHIDHIVPLSSFNFLTPFDEDFKRAWALTNLRPLWADENIRKNAKRLFLI